MIDCNTCKNVGFECRNCYDKSLYQPTSNNPYWDRITKVASNQRSKGIQEYGKGIEVDTAEINTRINRIEEELVDALMYLEHLRDKINERGDSFK